MSKRLTKIWALGLLLILTFSLRIINIEELFYFTYDESVPAFVARRLILWQHIPLIGGVTPFGFHLGPYFYWFYAILLSVGKLNPLIWGYAGAAIATITTLLIYKFGKASGSKKLAITAATFWTFSYLANVYDRHLWALYWGPLISLVTLISLYKIITSSVIQNPSESLHPCLSLRAKRSNLSITFGKFNILLGATIALGIHADPSNLVFLLLAVVVWFIYKLPVKKSTVVAIVIIISSFIPLVAFDLRHNFANTKPVLDFIGKGRNNPGFEINNFSENSLLFPRTFARLTYALGDNQISKQYSYCRNYVEEKFRAIPWYLIAASSVILVIFVVKNLRGSENTPGVKSSRRLENTPGVNQAASLRLITLLFVLYFFGIQIYGTIFRADIFEHYITGIFPAFLLILAYFVSLLPKKIWIIALALFVTSNLYKLSNAQNSHGLQNKRLAIEYTAKQVGDRPFSLDSLSTCWKLSGYRYLFTVFGREPVKSYVDPNFAYLYGTTPVAEKHPDTVVVFVTHDFAPETAEFYERYALLKFHEITSSLFGNIEVIILDNSSGWFDK